MNKEQFAKCPFCGKSETLTIGKASDAFSEPDECGDPMPYMHTESYAVTCNASKPDGPGGCGASGGYFPSEDEAIAAWNRRAEVERLADQAEPAPAPFAKDSWQHAVDNHLSALGKTSEEFPNPHEAVRWLLEFTSTLPVDAPAPVGEYPALPEPSSTAYIQGHSGGEYRTLSDSYEPDCAMFSPQQMHAYIDADRAQRPDREVRLLTSKDIDDVRKTLWRDAQMNLSDLHAEDAAKAFQCKFCEVNGLTVKDQS